MSADLVKVELEDDVASITMDDGKANALSFAMFEGLNGALDEAVEGGASAIVLTGRTGRFSGGFDLPVLTSLTPDSARLLRTGFELSHRLLSFPVPVVIACTGHAYAMGAFLLLSGDYRLGADDPAFRITANEVAIGMTLPRAAIELCRQRLTRAAFERATGLAEVFGPSSAVDAGWLDELAPSDRLLDAARAKGSSLLALDGRAHFETKLRARQVMLTTLQAMIDQDHREFLDLIAS